MVPVDHSTPPRAATLSPKRKVLPVPAYPSTVFSETKPEKREVPHISDREWAAGDSLLELFYVRVDQVPGQSSEVAIYGTITVDDANGAKIFWKRSQDSPLPISPGDYIPLEGPLKIFPISCGDPLGIEFDICAVDRGSSGVGASIAKVIIDYFPWGRTPKYEVETCEFRGDAGSLTVQYMPIHRALFALITVTSLPTGNGSDDHDDSLSQLSYQSDAVYGCISAHNGHGESELFRKSIGQHVRLVPGPTLAIPLSRDVVSVPRDETLRVQLVLMHQCSFEATTDSVDLTPNNEQVLLARGVVEFEPLYGEVQEKIVTGENDRKVVVKVNWG